MQQYRMGMSVGCDKARSEAAAVVVPLAGEVTVETMEGGASRAGEAAPISSITKKTTWKTQRRLAIV
ncbi:hypothetical protein QJS10_CPB17g00448 [Acorus calamus]|uniref:Uncharacterized protein n=1 Tax=Acorus calamus TaxID=4465 RepID=A0AAV9CRT4_ACOCL|nr:hypothetical protein QJS10_CPB17g00448 [Acorus calamus]